ncbi:MAG TPA: acyltransferase [Pseudonocardiaceae bacterium]|nr:acyltransferase [Pseudonocardiaceae bacterium]
MTAWTEQTTMIRPARPADLVVRCGPTDTMLAGVPVGLAMFFRGTLDIGRLADGLAVALTHVPVFAGRMRRGEDALLDIECGAGGVPLSVGDVDEPLGDAIGRVTIARSGYVDQVSDFEPLMRVKVSRLSDGGTVLGLSWHHAVGDMLSFVLLLRAWSAAVDGGPLPDTRVVLDRDAYLDAVLPEQDCGRPGFRLPDAAESEELNREVGNALAANRTVHGYFGAAEVARMRQKFVADAGRPLSANDVLCAHVTSTIRQLDNDAEDRLLTMPVNLRRPLGLADGAVGNLLGDVQVRCPAGGSPAALAARIRENVSGFADRHLNLRTNRAFLAAIGADRLPDCVPLGFDPRRRTMTITDWTRFGGYDITFQGHRPALVTPVANPPLPWLGWFIEGFDGTGVLATMVLPAKLAARLRGAEGRAAVHRYAEPGDVRPALADTVRKLV